MSQSHRTLPASIEPSHVLLYKRLSDAKTEIQDARDRKFMRENLHLNVKYFGFKIKPRAEGESDLYYVVRDQLQSNLRISINLDTLRMLVSQHVFNNKKLYEKFNLENIILNENSTEDKIAELTFLALSRALNITIVIIHEDVRPIIFRRHFSHTTIYLGFVGGLQYESLVQEDLTLHKKLERYILRYDFDTLYPRVIPFATAKTILSQENSASPLALDTLKEKTQDASLPLPSFKDWEELSIEDKSLHTQLILAIMGHHTEGALRIIEKLPEKLIHVIRPAVSSRSIPITALTTAVYYINEEVVAALLQRGTNPNIPFRDIPLLENLLINMLFTTMGYKRDIGRIEDTFRIFAGKKFGIPHENIISAYKIVDMLLAYGFTPPCGWSSKLLSIGNKVCHYMNMRLENLYVLLGKSNLPDLNNLKGSNKILYEKYCEDKIGALQNYNLYPFLWALEFLPQEIENVKAELAKVYKSLVSFLAEITPLPNVLLHIVLEYARIALTLAQYRAEQGKHIEFWRTIEDDTVNIPDTKRYVTVTTLFRQYISHDTEHAKVCDIVLDYLEPSESGRPLIKPGP